MKTTFKALCAAGMLAVAMALPAHAGEKMGGKMPGKMMGAMDAKMSCSMCSDKGNNLCAHCCESMTAKMSASEKKTFMGMSAAEKALVGKMMKNTMSGGKMENKGMMMRGKM